MLAKSREDPHRHADREAQELRRHRANHPCLRQDLGRAGQGRPQPTALRRAVSVGVQPIDQLTGRPVPTTHRARGSPTTSHYEPSSIYSSARCTAAFDAERSTTEMSPGPVPDRWEGREAGRSTPAAAGSLGGCLPMLVAVVRIEGVAGAVGRALSSELIKAMTWRRSCPLSCSMLAIRTRRSGSASCSS